jgi:hypothetical protein
MDQQRRVSLDFLDSPSQSKMKGLRRLYHRDRPPRHENRPTTSNDKSATKTEWGVLRFLNLLFLELNLLLLVCLLYSFLFTGFIRFWVLAYGLFRLIVGSLRREPTKKPSPGKAKKWWQPKKPYKSSEPSIILS